MKDKPIISNAMRRWSEFPESTKERILANVWCRNCKTGVLIQFRSAEIKQGMLLLNGTCSKCGKDVARLIGPEE